MTNRRLRPAGLLAMLAIGGCGDSDGSSAGIDLGSDASSDAGGSDSCKGAPCGGDLIGAWAVQELCVGAAAVTDCADPPPATPGSIVYRDVAVSGTFDFVDDGSFALNLMFMGTIDLTLPSDCDVTCEDYWSVQFGSTPNCTTGPEGCSCSEALTDTSSKAGTWSASGSTAEFTGIGGVFGDPVNYCVGGTRVGYHELGTLF